MASQDAVAPEETKRRKAQRSTAGSCSRLDFKGSGKGSLGDPLEEEPSTRENSPGDDCAYPEPRKYSEAQIEEMLNGGYYRPPPVPFWAGEDQMTIKPGATVLWRSGEKLGKNGGPSTKIEYFHGKVDGWNGDRIVFH